MYFGESNEADDLYLAEVAKELDNVVIASLVNFESKVEVNENGDYVFNFTRSGK